MRAFLSSYRFGDHVAEFQELVGDDAAIGIIHNAKDYKSPAERSEGVHSTAEVFKDAGYEPYEIDLRNYFGNVDSIRSKLEEFDVIWLAGGNSFVLARALKESHADTVLRELVHTGKIIYGGESAGAVMATPTLRGIEFGDDPYVVPDGYADEDVWEGLGLVPYSIVPHYESAWEGYERMVEVLEEEDIPYKTLHDHEVILVAGEDEVVLS